MLQTLAALRTLFAGALALSIASPLASSAKVGGKDLPPASTAGATSLVLLGTAGGPGATAARAGIASLVRVGDKSYLVDAGIGVARQLARAGLAERDVRLIFLTHLHDDHTAGLPGLLTFAYTLRTRGVQVFGPPNTDRLIDGVLAYMAPNAKIRQAEQGGAPPATLILARPVREGVVYRDSAITVTAVENAHYHFASHASEASYAYKFQTPDKVIVFTGDTGPSAAVEKLAAGADVLVSEMTSNDVLTQVPLEIMKHMIQDHLSPSQVGMLAANANVKLLILSHIRSVSQQDVAQIRAHFRGRIIVGEDLDCFLACSEKPIGSNGYGR